MTTTKTRSPWEVAADILDPPHDNWDPLPHQIPPAGDWFAWILLGGRGSGKTAAAARYIHDHVHGPPCIPTIPGGHWVGIVAPTLGDAVTSCVTGPSGLRVHDPGLKVTQGVGGAMVRWSNGAEAKLFGAHSPEDIERFRSGGNRCLSEGTKVLTDQGEIPIEQVRPGSQVMTRSGWREVTHNWNNGVRKTIQLHLSNGRTLTCTPDHKIWADGSWEEALHVPIGARIASWPTHTIQESISKSGKRHTERSRKGTRCIIGTTTRATIPSTISSFSLGKNTGQSIPKREELIGTRREVRLLSPSRSRTQLPMSASTAVKSSRLYDQLGAAQILAESCSSGSTQSSVNNIRSTSAPTAGLSSAEEGWQDSVVLCAVIEGPEVRVYDLSIRDQHEFYAEGALVHNCCVWTEELAAFRYMAEAWEQIRYGLRVGPRPHVIISTTPKARKVLKKIIQDPTTAVTRATTAENPYLDSGVKKRLFEDYGGTRMGRQELYGEILEDIEGALWTGDLIEAHRIQLMDLPRRMEVIAVGVDPGAKDTDNSDETGIITTGRVNNWNPAGKTPGAPGPHGFVLADYSVRGKPEKWAKAVIQAFDDYSASFVVVEINNGGDMVKHTLQTYRSTLPVKEVHASRGKVQRAEPVFTLYEQGRIHHVGVHPVLEDQMTTFDVMDPDPSWSPDHMDAMVWSVTKLLVSDSMLKKSTLRDNRLKGRR